MKRFSPQRAVAVSTLACAFALTASAQQPAPDPPAPSAISIATVPTQGVSVSGSLSVADGRAVIGNNGSITAGDKTAHVHLTRGGELNVCASTQIHLSTDNSTPGGALMIALDRGALEAHYTPGQYSDVLLTPDLRILISPPGEADLSLRVNNQGDTCVDNHGDHAPYVLASSLFDGGAYRIQPNQRVLFEHGSLRAVVDNEQEPCGCPPAQPLSIASAGTPGSNPAHPGQPVAPNASENKAAADNPFPLAESEGLQPPPPLSSKPAVPAGHPHAEVEAPLLYNSAAPPPPPAAATAPTAQPERTIAQASPAPKPHRSFFGHIGHFFAHLFGAK
ncbi:MAG TPA: hypothetical protein VHZ09_01735 [Acidobacteriaceae bacterium]|jgi:hypothetical protein|nr:hypothetical protein [Acidobacteriaceae bacterium]